MSKNIFTTISIADVEFFVRIEYEESPELKVTSLAIPMGDEGQMDLSRLLVSPELHQSLVDLIQEINTPTEPDDDPWRRAFMEARDGFI